MAQTTDGMSFRASLGFVSDDEGATWVTIADHGASVAVTGGERTTGEQNTMEGDTPIVKAGKRASIDVTCRYVYTEEAADPFEVIRAAYETAGGPLRFQYSPKDGFWYDTGNAICIQHQYPGGDVMSGDVIMSEFVIKCASLTKATASTEAA